MATELARLLPDGVLAADADTGLGSLPRFLGAASSDLDAGSEPSGETDLLLRRTVNGLWVLPRDSGTRLREHPDTATLQTTLAANSRRFSTAVIDCGVGIRTQLNQALIGKSHGLILVAPATGPGIDSINGALEWFAETGHTGLPARTVIALVEHSPEQNADQAKDQLSPNGPPVIAVPFDADLAEGKPLDAVQVSAAVQDAVARITYEVFSRALHA